MKLLARLFAVTVGTLVTVGAQALAATAPTPAVLTKNEFRDSHHPTAFRFSHGNISWLPVLAEEAGWPRKTWARLGQIILRESGGCPNRRGGDAVDSECNITHVTEWNHRSDTGLLQINGVNYDKSRNKWAVICNQMGICEQGPLLDPLTNLKAGLILWKVAGWDPWTVG